MLQNKLLIILWGIISIFAFFSSLSFASSDWITSPQKGHRGWYGYEPLKDEQKEKKNYKKKHADIKQEHNKLLSNIKWPTPDELYNLKPSKIQEWINKASDEAITHPTESNIKRWITYLKVADRKATEFAGMWSWVIQNNPELYKEAALYPTVNPGNRAFWKNVWGNILETLRKKSNEYALLFFKGNDQFSSAMEFILNSFKKKHPNWKIREINIQENFLMAKKFNITYVPQIWILSRKLKKAVPLVAGPASVATLEKKIYHTVMVIEGKILPQYAPYYQWQIPTQSRKSK